MCFVERVSCFAYSGNAMAAMFNLKFWMVELCILDTNKPRERGIYDLDIL